MNTDTKEFLSKFSELYGELSRRTLLKTLFNNIDSYPTQTDYVNYLKMCESGKLNKELLQKVFNILSELSRRHILKQKINRIDNYPTDSDIIKFKNLLCE